MYLAIAFEILLTDNYSAGVSGVIYERASTLLKGTRGNQRLKTAVRDLYEARSNYVHTGKVSDTLDLKTARMAFIHSFLLVSSKIKMNLPSSVDTPMKRLIGIN